MGEASGRTTSSGWQLTHLFLSFNPLGEDALLVLEALRPSCGSSCRLQQLRLHSCRLPAASGAALGRLVVACPALAFLDASDNKDLGKAPGGARAFLEAAVLEWGLDKSSCRAAVSSRVDSPC